MKDINTKLVIHACISFDGNLLHVYEFSTHSAINYLLSISEINFAQTAFSLVAVNGTMIYFTSTNIVVVVKSFEYGIYRDNYLFEKQRKICVTSL